MFKEEIVITCDSDDIKDLIFKHYGIEDYEMQYYEHVYLDTYKFYEINGKLTEKEQTDLYGIQPSNSKRFMTKIILNDLASKNVVKTGRYLIHVI